MARPTKQGIDYFPIDCQFDDKIEMYLIEKGAVGLGVLVALWQMIYSNEGYYIANNKDLHLLIKKRVDVDVNEVSDCINICLERNLFNHDLHQKYGILTSKAIQKRFFDAAKKKKSVSVVVDYVINSIDSCGNWVYVDGNATNVKEDVNVNVKEDVNVNVKEDVKGEGEKDLNPSLNDDVNLKFICPEDFEPNKTTIAKTHRAGCRPHITDDLIAFTSHYRAKGDVFNASGWQEKFTAWMVRQKQYDSQATASAVNGGGHKKTKKPDWAKVPTVDDDLWPWAEKHGYPGPGQMDYYQYRRMLWGKVNERQSNGGIANA